MGSIPKAQQNSSKTSIDQPSSDDNEPRLPKEISPLTIEVSALADISLPTKPVVSQSVRVTLTLKSLLDTITWTARTTKLS